METVWEAHQGCVGAIFVQKRIWNWARKSDCWMIVMRLKNKMEII
jgi:hypothetical protein